MTHFPSGNVYAGNWAHQFNLALFCICTIKSMHLIKRSHGQKNLREIP